MESTSRLRVILSNATSPRASSQVEQELFEELVALKPLLVKILDFGPRRPEEQKEIESGKAVVNGKPLAFNADFARQTIFLSQQLDCSEMYIAGLLHYVMTRNPHMDSVTCAEAIIIELHKRRRNLVDCLYLILAEAAKADLPDPAKVHVRLEKFVTRELLPGYEIPGGRTHLAQEAFRQIDALDATVSKVQTDRQNAGSNTFAPSTQAGVTSLGQDILTARLESLKYERRILAVILFLIARSGHLRPVEIPKMVEWLSSHPNHAMTFYILTSTLAAFDPVDLKSSGGKARNRLAHDKETVEAMTNLLGPATNWKDPGLKATILLKWTLFLTQVRQRDPDLEFQSGFKAEELETQVWNAVQGGAFSYLALAVLQLQRQGGFSSLAGLMLSQEQERLRVVPDDDFKKMVLYAFESLVQSLITYASSELRKIKQKQEDVVLANVRSDRSRTLRASTPHGTRPGPEAGGSSTTTPRTDIATLFSLIGLLYTALPPEHALPFWGASPHTGQIMYSEHTASKLPQFLQWAAWSTQARDVGMTTALFDMLAGLAHGQQCSELAYNFLARGGSEVLPGSAPSSTSSAYSERSTVSWTALFDLLESWTSSAAAKPLPVPQHPSASVMSTSSLNQAPSASQRQPAFELGPSHVLLAQSFLRLLSTVVRCSVTVRLAITGNTRFRAIPTLVSLIPLGIPLEMKGALFDTLSSFCEPGAGAPGIEICKAVWALMERLEVINVRATRGGFAAPHTQGKGVELELEEVETVYKFYPATIPFLKLLSTLIHSQKRIPLKSRLTESEPTNTIPESLGLPYRLPGLGPFVSFVLDTVFAKIPMREYLRQSDRWQINDLCLTFVERCLASYDLENLASLVENRQLTPDSMVPFLVHPGYDIMKRLLTSSPFQASVLSYIVEGVEGFDRQFADEEPFFHSTIIRVLRIVLRVLEIQDSFLDILIPASAEFACVDIIGVVHTRSYFTRFDYALSLGRQFVPALVSYVAHPKHAELVLLSVRITAKLSASQAFPNLLTFVERSSESERILSGFRHIMDVESLDDVNDAVASADNCTGAGAPNVGGPHLRLDQAIRLAALDLFIQDTDSSRPYPNIGHFLLFGGYGRDFHIQNPHALGSRQTCIHVILDLLNEGIPRRAKGDSKLLHASYEVDPLFIMLPALAERCYKVLYQLCTHPKTSEFVMRYLRTQEDFFARHIAVIPAKAPEMLLDPYIEVLYADSIRVTTTVSALSSFLRLRSWIIDLVALDLHVLTHKGHHKGVGELLEIFFGDVSGQARHSDGSEDHALHGVQKLGQSHLQIIEFLQSLNFDWFDSLTLTPIDMDLLKGIDLQSCVREDETGCEIVDRVALLSLLNAAKRSLHSHGRIVTQAHAEQLRAEINYVLESCAVENHRRAVQHSVTTSFEAWRRLLDIILAKCFQRIPHDRRENMLFDLLRVLPNALRSPNIEKSSAVLLSEAILSSITKLREDRRHQIVIQSAGGDAGSSSLPSERLYHLFRNILECILEYTHLELVRGNLYASLINYLHLIAPEDMEPEGTKQNSLAISLTASTSSIYSFTSSGSINGTSQASLVKSTLAIMKQIIERLVTTISRDAIDGTEVWKTVAFTCLDSLVQLSRAEREQVVVSAMVRQGILTNFVVGLTDSDLRLQGILKPEPDDLNPLYVYEAKMSLFTRMTQSRAGAECLLEAHILSVLTKCDFLDARPESDQTFIQQDSFLPPAIQRYHQLLIPALQVVNGILTSLGPKHKAALDQALDFLSSHRDTIVILLKSEVDQLSLAVLEEMHLLVSLCSSVLPLVPNSELNSAHSGFGAVHNAILGLASRMLNFRRGPWSLVHQDDAEKFDATSYTFGLNSKTRAALEASHKEQLLRKGIIVYLGAASDYTEPEMSLVLTPVVTTQKLDQSVSQFSANVPAIGDAIEALDDLCSHLSGTLKVITSLTAEIAAKEHIRVDNIQDLVDVAASNFLQDIDVAQKRNLVSREFERIRNVHRTHAQTLLDATEMLLLLLWRHLDFYSRKEQITVSDLRASHAGMTRLLAVPETETFRAELRRRLTPIFQRLYLDLDSLRDEWTSKQEYIREMCRRIKGTIGLHDPTDSTRDGL